MSAYTTRDFDPRQIGLTDCRREAESVTFTGAGTYKAGTLLARDTSTQKLVPFVKGGTTNGNGVVRGILDEDRTASGAGDLQSRVILSGNVSFDDILIYADGNNSNIDHNVKDGLAVFEIYTYAAEENSLHNNS